MICRIARVYDHRNKEGEEGEIRAKGVAEGTGDGRAGVAGLAVFGGVVF